MSHSVCNDMAYVQGGGCRCNGGTPPMVFRSVWDRLCQQIFGAIPPGMDTENQLPDIEIWDESVVLVSENNGEFTFTVTTSSGKVPKPTDVISYKGKFYVIGEVDL